MPIGVGNSGLLGGDLTDPLDEVKEKEGINWGSANSETEMRPPNAPWVDMLFEPASLPGTPPHQIHAYQSWQGSPACAIFMNKPDTMKWYLGFKDGGNGGPTETAPYYCAVKLKQPFVLTHFTITTSPGMPGRDPRQWAIQGSNTADDDDWTEIYRCDATTRAMSPLKVDSRLHTTLLTSFTSENMSQAVGPGDLKKLKSRLVDRKIAKADYPKPKWGYTWYRIVVTSCFNPNSMTFADFNRPPGFALGQLELFGVPGTPAPPKPRVPRVKWAADKLIKPEAYDPAFIISYWCGPPRSETNLERYQELADCGFNVALMSIDCHWEQRDAAQEKHNQKILDLCQQVGMKALIWDGDMLKVGAWDSAPKPEEIPQMEKVLDSLIARYSSHPAFLGLVEGDEGISLEGNHRLGVVNQYLLKKDPKHLPYFNLLPAYAFNPLSKYEEYVSKFIEDAKPAMVSWDHYRQLFGGGDENTYWYNLELMRERCVKARLPYNQIIVSLKHMGYREASEIDLRWQVYTSLAYGSRGIQYFTYWFTKGLAWADAPSFISKEGKRDRKWDYAKKINHRIAKLGPILARLTCTGAYCTAPVPPGAKALAAGGPVKQAKGGPMVIGCFQSPEGKEYLMVVNRSFNSPITAKLTLHFQIMSTAEISQETGERLEAVPTSKGPLEVVLLPGEGRLFELSDSGLFFQPPTDIFGGRDLELNSIYFEPQKPGSKAAGNLFWRSSGGTQFASLPLVQTDPTHFKVTLPATATQAPFDYYLEVLEPSEKPARYPALGAEAPLLATPDQTAPTSVPELTSPMVKSYQVALEWKPSSDDRGVTGYRVYRGKVDGFALSEEILLVELTKGETRYLDEKPLSKETAWYAVQAIDVVGRSGEVRYLRTDVPDHQPPANVLQIHAVPASKAILLSWTGELEPNVNAIEIHRGNGKDGELKKIAEVTDFPSSQYLDKETEYGTDYHYVVRPRSSAGLLGSPGLVVSASPLRYLKRINCGGPEIATDDGVPWEADSGKGHAFMGSGGTKFSHVRGVDLKKEIFLTERWVRTGMRYNFPVDPGRYEIVLEFAETNPGFFAKGKRLFNIYINDDKVGAKIDVFTEAGGASRSWQFRKTLDITAKNLVIKLLASPVGPSIKGIEVRGLPPE